MNKDRVAFVIALLAVMLLASASTEAASLKWDVAFPTDSAPKQAYFRAHYRDGRGQLQQLQVWRDGKNHLRRRTDDAIDLYVERNKADDLDFRLVDYSRGVIIHGDRASLLRVGRFAGWAVLAHILAAPQEPYRVTEIQTERGQEASRGCVWFRIRAPVTSSKAHDVCWSRQWGLPLFFEATDDKEQRLVQFAVREARTFKPKQTIFAIDTSKFLEVDAKQDDNPFD